MDFLSTLRRVLTAPQTESKCVIRALVCHVREMSAPPRMPANVVDQVHELLLQLNALGDQGRSDDEGTWLERSRIEREIAEVEGNHD